MEPLTGLDWDDGNLTKSQRHGVSVEEIAELFAGNPIYVPDERHSSAEPRQLAIGKSSAGRALFVAFTTRMRDG